jgi:hypothetical protein
LCRIFYDKNTARPARTPVNPENLVNPVQIFSCCGLPSDVCNLLSFPLDVSVFVRYDFRMGTRKTTPAKPSSRSPVPATRDTFVHYLFGTKKYEPILLSFINAVLENGGRSKR